MTTVESDAILKLIKNSEEELEYTDMLSGRVVGQLLRNLVAVGGAKRILEIGTFTGYSALMMAEVLPDDGEIITIEMNMRYQELAEKHFDMHPDGSKINLVKANAREYVPVLKPHFDLIYIDADKIYYPEYYNLTVPLLRENGLLIADNVLWDATVLDPQDPKAEAMHRFNERVHNDPRTEQVLLPVRDGVTVIRKLPV
jgi:caffeoyl-CoA O-methyltransferase